MGRKKNTPQIRSARIPRKGTGPADEDESSMNQVAESADPSKATTPADAERALYANAPGRDEAEHRKILRFLALQEMRQRQAQARRIPCVQVAPVRTSTRAPRRASASRPRPATRVDSDDGPPPVLVSQATSHLVGLTRRGFLRLVHEKGLRHAKVGRLLVVRLDHVLAALGLADAPVAAPEPARTSADIVRDILSGTRKAGAR